MNVFSRKNCFFIFGLLWLHLLCSADDTQAFRTLSVDFTRSYTENTRIDSLKGRLSYSTDGIVYIRTEFPARQYLRIEKNSMLIYYPESRQAFRVQQQKAFELPFVQMLVWTFDTKTNLEKSGYIFVKVEKSNDTLVETWKPPKYLARYISRIMIRLGEKRTVYGIETLGTAKQSTSKTDCSEYIYTVVFPFPRKMVTSGVINKIPFTETVTFDRPAFNQQQEHDRMVFTIPPEVRIKEVRL